MLGQKHMIECHCILPIYKNKSEPIYHKFTVYSKFDENNKIIPKYQKCNNCGTVHFVYEICKSDVKIGKEDTSNLCLSIKDLSIGFSDKLVKILEDYNCEIDVYEIIEDVFHEKIFPFDIILKREIIDEEYNIKILTISGNDNFKIKTEIIKTIIK